MTRSAPHTLHILLAIGFAAAFHVPPVSARSWGQNLDTNRRQHTASALMSLNEAFSAYCELPDAARWVCTRKDEVSRAQKYRTIRAYCASPRDKAIDSLSRSPSSHVSLCDAAIEVPLWIEFDHQTARWSPGPTLAEKRVEIGPTSKPEVELATGDELGIVVTNTNPALFMLRPGKVTESDIDELEGLRTFFSTLGGALTNATQVSAVLARAKSFGKLSQGGLKPQIAGRVNEFNASMAAEAGISPPESCNMARAAAAAVEDLEWLEKIDKPLRDSLGALSNRSSRLFAQEAHFIDVARRFEREREETTTRWTPSLSDVPTWNALFGDVERALGPQADGRHPAVCQARLAAYRMILSAPPDKPSEVHRLALEFLALLESEPKCGSELEDLLASHAKALLPIAARAAEAAFPLDEPGKAVYAAGVRKLSLALGEGRACFMSPIAGESGALEGHSTLAATARTVIGPEKRKQLLDVAASLHTIAERLERSAFRYRVLSTARVETGMTVPGDLSEKTCPSPAGRFAPIELWLEAGASVTLKIGSHETKYSATQTTGVRREPVDILNHSTCPSFEVEAVDGNATLVAYEISVDSVLFLPTEPFRGPWHKVRESEVIVSRGTSLLKDVVSDRSGDVTTSYKIIPRTGALWGAGVGLVFTDITSRTFVSVDGVVAETARDSRAGTQAFFANYKFGQHFVPDSVIKPGLEFGAGIDGDKPSLLLGLSLEVFRYARVGIGTGWFRTTQLVGPGVGTPLPTGTSVHTRQKFANRWYASFTFALDSLKLFGS